MMQSPMYIMAPQQQQGHLQPYYYHPMVPSVQPIFVDQFGQPIVPQPEQQQHP